MLHLESAASMDSRARGWGAAADPVAGLAYRSRPVAEPTPAELDDLLRKARQRNRLEGLTGLLIYDHGFFFQWLEGPKSALQRVWESIRRDPRHTDLTILRDQMLPRRFFTGWDLRLARRTRGDLDRIFTVMETPRDLLAKLRLQPSVLADAAWDEVFADAILPRVGSVLVPQRANAAGAGSPRVIAPRRLGAAWHPPRGVGAELAGILLAVDGCDTDRYVGALIEQGAGLETLFQEVFEPAARCLGGLWEEDRCDEFHVTLALGRLQLEVHRLSRSLARQPPAMLPGHAILIAPQPGEAHGLNATMNRELFVRDGWDVSHKIPSDNNGLRDILHENWFDVLDLSLSGALRREQQLPAMRVTIRAARAASLNPEIAVMVDGRSFVDRPDAYLEVGADLACVTSTGAVSAARALLRTQDATAEPEATAQLDGLVQVSVG
jgi:hypothetical protein